MTKKTGPLRIAIRLDTTKTFHRACVRGLLSYVKQNQPAWSFASDAGNRLWMVRPDELPDFHPDVLVGVFTAAELEKLNARHIRCLSLLTHVTDGKVGVIASDDREIGALAANHFADQELCHCLYYGVVVQQTHSQLRFDGFAETLKKRTGNWPMAMKLDLDRINFTGVAGRRKHLEEIVATIQNLRARSGTPIGVFAFSDDLAASVIEACLGAGLRIPDEVAVVGVDNDDLICETMSPALTSIKQNGEGIGFRTGEVLDAMFQHTPLPKSPILMPPLGLMVRASSDTLAIKDPIVARAVRIIRSKVGESLNVEALAEELGVSRRLLAKRFREALQRTPHDEIVHTRIRLAKTLRADTDMTNLTVALECGFHGEHRFEQNFRSIVGVTPFAYRKQLRPALHTATTIKHGKNKAVHSTL